MDLKKALLVIIFIVSIVTVLLLAHLQSKDLQYYAGLVAGIGIVILVLLLFRSKKKHI
jgi:uncharacterized membrane protein